MTNYNIVPIDEPNHFGPDEIIVSKTDLKGRITYANHIFCRVAEMPTKDLIGEPHSIIRHPDMPRCVFKLLWDTLATGKEIFAYVKNMARSGRYYWVLAHVTPSYDSNGRVVGYHSNRRVPKASAIKAIEPIYKQLLAEENKHSNKKQGMEASFAMLVKTLGDLGKTYDEFIWELSED